MVTLYFKEVKMQRIDHLTNRPISRIKLAGEILFPLAYLLIPLCVDPGEYWQIGWLTICNT
jgi:hypothetical protein